MIDGLCAALFTAAETHRPQRRHLAHAGRPAAALGLDGMPAYESEAGALLVMECLLAFLGGFPGGTPLLLPRTYSAATARAPSGLAALHDDPDAVWSWRPLIYSVGAFAGATRLGSQQELEYRIALAQVQGENADRIDVISEIGERHLRRLRARYPAARAPKNARKRASREYAEEAAAALAAERPKLDYVVARERARTILLEHLSPQQRIDLATKSGFFVRGEINRLYFVEPSNGLMIVDAVTHEPKVSLCLHPDEWMPHDDVALATKLALDAGRESEAELLEAARPRLLPSDGAETWRDRRAYALERRYELYP